MTLATISTPESAELLKKSLYSQPVELQNSVLKYLVANGLNTHYGVAHNFSKITNYETFKRHVPIREYHDFDKYWDLVFKREANVLWPGLPTYLALTSASTGRAKHIPVTNDSLASFVSTVITIIMQYVNDKQDFSLFDYDFLNLSSNPNFNQHHSYLTGAMSAICRQSMPTELLKNSYPSAQQYEIMTSQGFDAMFTQIAQNIKQTSFSVCAGLPSWLAQFFQICCAELDTQNLTEYFPNLKLLILSGVNYRPYIGLFKKLFNQQIDIREMYAASEGVFAFQDSDSDNGMLLNLNAGIFFEFVALEEINANSPHRMRIQDVKLNTPYVPIISTNAGLWGYKMGDIIEFTTLKPYRVRVLGRTKHYISVVAEHVYSEQVEEVIEKINSEWSIDIINFTVSPSLISTTSLPYYNWYIEMRETYDLDLEHLAREIDRHLMLIARSYSNRRKEHMLAGPTVHLLRSGSFLQYLSQNGSHSMQLKIPKVSNNCNLAEYFIKHNKVIKETLLPYK